MMPLYIPSRDFNSKEFEILLILHNVSSGMNILDWLEVSCNP